MGSRNQRLPKDTHREWLELKSSQISSDQHMLLLLLLLLHVLLQYLLLLLIKERRTQDVATSWTW